VAWRLLARRTELRSLCEPRPQRSGKPLQQQRISFGVAV